MFPGSFKEIQEKLKGKAAYAALLIGVTVLALVYTPIGIARLNYYFTPVDEESVDRLNTAFEKQILDTLNETDSSESIEDIFADMSDTKSDFIIYIPKLNILSTVNDNVDPFKRSEYEAALRSEIAHAAGTSLPGSRGNTFVFAHSAIDFYDLVRNNVQFYLLGELEDGDEIFIYYQKHLYKYEVEANEIVDPTEIEYLTDYKEYNTLTLMTCWPAGTDYKRNIVTAKEVF